MAELTTSWMRPCPQMVMAGNGMSSMGKAVVDTEVMTGLSCQSK